MRVFPEEEGQVRDVSEGWRMSKPHGDGDVDFEMSSSEGSQQEERGGAMNSLDKSSEFTNRGKSDSLGRSRVEPNNGEV